eukprot:3548418-Pyramimonas_sp.AAC.1
MPSTTGATASAGDSAGTVSVGELAGPPSSFFATGDPNGAISIEGPKKAVGETNLETKLRLRRRVNEDRGLLNA